MSSPVTAPPSPSMHHPTRITEINKRIFGIADFRIAEILSPFEVLLISNFEFTARTTTYKGNSSFERHASLAFQPPSPTKGTPSTDTRYS